MHEVTEFVLPTYQTLLLAFDGPVATVTLNRPAVLNALNAQMFTDLESVFTLLAGNPTIHAVLVTGAGPKAFAAGADIAELAGTDAASGEQLARRGQAIFSSIERCGKPVIACINGYALGGGCELALACTLRLASETARLGTPELKLGLIPGYGGTQRLPRIIGPGAALRMILTGSPVSATDALRIGLVDEVVVPDQLLQRGHELALQLAAQPPLAVAAAIDAVQRGAALPLDDALKLEATVFGTLSASADKHEGVQAFLEKRAPVFVGK